MGDVYDTIAVYWLPTLIAVLMFGIGTAIGSWLARRAWTRFSSAINALVRERQPVRYRVLPAH